MAAQPDLHRMARIDLALIDQVGPPMGRGFLGPEEMIHLGKDICMGVEMQETDLLALGDPAPPQRLHDAACDRMIAPDRDRARACGVDFGEEPGDLLDAILVVVCAGKGHVAHIDDLGRCPRIKLELAMHPPCDRRDVAQGARAQMLIPLGRAVAGGMRHARKGDVLPLRPLVGAAEHGGDAPPIQVVHHGFEMFVSHALHPCQGRKNAPRRIVAPGRSEEET